MVSSGYVSSADIQSRRKFARLACFLSAKGLCCSFTEWKRLERGKGLDTGGIIQAADSSLVILTPLATLHLRTYTWGLATTCLPAAAITLSVHCSQIQEIS